MDHLFEMNVNIKTNQVNKSMDQKRGYATLSNYITTLWKKHSVKETDLTRQVKRLSTMDIWNYRI